MIEGLSINGIWPAGLPVALGVVLLTILAVRIFAGGVRRGNLGREEDRSQGPARPDSRQVLEDVHTRSELTKEDDQERLRVLGGASDGTSEPATGLAITSRATER